MGKQPATKTNDSKEAKKIGRGLIWFGSIVSVLWICIAVVSPWAYHASGAPGWSWIESHWGKPSLGETGDYLTGWLTPLALFWFVITVFLQREELKEQRNEFIRSREAAEAHAGHQEQSNELSNRLLVRGLIQDSRDFTQRNAELTLEALNDLSGNFNPHSVAGGPLDRLKTWRRVALGLLTSNNTGSGMTLSTIWSENQRLTSNGLRARELISSMADQYSDLRQEAVKAEMEEYFDAFCVNTMEGEVMRMCRDLCDKADTDMGTNG